MIMTSPSLDWHPTDHVSFSDNAHLRTIARESKVQVIMEDYENHQNYNDNDELDDDHGNDDKDDDHDKTGSKPMSNIRRGDL